MARNKGEDKNSEKPKEISKDCPHCGTTITALPSDMTTAMSLHIAFAHGK